jgi:Ca2+-binding RTX toxin-like protein
LGIDLPMYFPTPSLPMGGTEDDVDGDGVPDNVMQVRADLDQTGLSNIQVATPTLGNQFSIFNIFNNPELFVDAFDATLTALQDGLNGGIFDVTLPFIGKISDTAAAQAVTQFMSDIQTSIIGTYDNLGTPEDEGSGLKGFVQGKSTVEVLQEAIFNLLGPGTAFATPGLDILVDDTNQKITDPSDVMLDINEEFAQFNMRMADTLAMIEVPLSFDAGIAGLNLDIDTSILIELNYVMEFGLGVDFENLEFYFDASGATPSGAEMSLTLDAVLAPDARVTRDNEGNVTDTPLVGQLAFLKIGVGDDDDYDPVNWRTDGLGERPSGVFGEFAVDLLDPDNDAADGERLTITEIQNSTTSQILEARLNAVADVDLFAEVTIPEFSFNIGSNSFDLQFPELSTTVHYDQVFAEASTNGPANTFGGKPMVTFEDVTLDLGKFITAFISPIIEQVHQVTEPVEPIADILTTEISLLKELGAPVTTLLDIAEVALGQTKYAPVVRAVEAIIDVITIIDTVAEFIDSGAESIMINFGTFTIGDGIGDDLRSGDSSTMTAPQPNAGGLDTDRDINGSNLTGSQKESTKEVVKQIGTTPGSFQFPILTNPSSAIGLLMGQTADLFTYDLPALDLNFQYVRSFPIFPGLNARFGGGVTATTDFSFGFDTSGIQKWIDGGPVSDIFDGFFIGDWDENNNDVDEVTLTASIIAGASVGIGGLVEAGVDGGIEATIGFDLNDVPNPGTGKGTPNPAQYDGKIRAGELIQRIDQGVECIFSVHGELTAFLEAFFWVGLDLGFFGEITIFEARERFVNEVLASFTFDCPDPDPPVISTFSGGAVPINGGAGSGTGGVGVVTLNYQPADGNVDQGERYFVDRLDVPIDPTDPQSPLHNVIRVSSRGFVEDYDPNTVGKIVAFGTNFDDQFIFGENLTTDVEVHGAGGHDIIEVNTPDPQYTIELYGDSGNDMIMGGAGNDLLVGGFGKDVIGGNGGNDTIFGEEQTVARAGAGVEGVNDDPVDRPLHDQLFGGEGDDEIHGGAGNDLILGEAGMDMLFGDAGQDEIFGGDQDDIIRGGPDDDILKGEAGNDTIFGEGGRDAITGGLDLDILDGGPQGDTFLWAFGDGNDLSLTGGSSQTLDTGTNELVEDTDTYKVTHDGVFNDTVVVRPGATDDVEFHISGNDNLLDDIERLFVEVGEGADDVTVHSLINTTVTDVDIDFGLTETEVIREEPLLYAAGDQLPAGAQVGDIVLNGEGLPVMAQFITIDTAKDGAADSLHLFGTTGGDDYDIGTPTDPANPQLVDSIFINHSVISTGKSTTYSVTNAESNPVAMDAVVVESRPENNGGADDGEDQVDSAQVVEDLAEWTFITGNGNDVIVGSPLVETIDSGPGDDTVTGGLGVDIFIDADGMDTLIEFRDEADLIFSLSDTQLQIGAEIEALDDIFETVRLTSLNDSNAQGEIHEDDNATIGELSLALFKIGIPEPDLALYDNEFYVSNWTHEAIFDGGEGADIYFIELSGSGDPSVASLVDVTDTGNKGLDRVEILGTGQADTFAFRQDIVERILFAEEGDFSRVTEFNTDIITRDSGSAAGFRQAVNYLSVENVYIKGGDGEDLFVLDDTSTEVFVYGQGGNDLFFVGNIVSTKKFNDPLLGEIDIVDEITNGVTFPAVFYGGDDDDYFEVNHNIAPIALFGEKGDDIFFLRAHLTTEPASGKTMSTSGAEMHVTSTDQEQDVLSYVKNAPVKIHGGEGFDTLVIVGTAAGDTFTIFVEEENGSLVQRIFGAGLIVPEIEEIEQLVIVTGGGDDTIFVYGLLPGQNILINTGGDNDTVFFGGEAVSFEVIIPEFQKTVTEVIPAYKEQTITQVIRPAYSYPKVTYPYKVLGITLPIPVIQVIRVPALTRTRTIQVRDPANDQVIPQVIIVPEQIIPVTMPETRELTSLQGIVEVESPAGTNTLIVNNQSAIVANSTGVLTANGNGTSFLHGLGMGDNGVVYENMDNVHINLGNHDDRFTVESTPLATQTTVNGSSGDDAFFVGAITDLVATNPILASRVVGVNRLGLIRGELTFRGALGNNVLTLSDIDTVVARSGELNATRLTGMGLGSSNGITGIHYFDINALDMFLGAGVNTLTVEDTHANATHITGGNDVDIINVLAISGPTDIHTGLGNDIIQVGSVNPDLGGTLNAIASTLHLDTGDGDQDQLIVDDSADLALNTGTLSSNAVSGLGTSDGIQYENVEDVDLFLGEGGNQFTLASTITGSSDVTGNLGGDDVYINQVDGPTAVDTAGGNDTIHVGSLAPQVNSTLDTILAALSINDSGDADSDLLRIDHTGDAQNQEATLAANLLTGLGLPDTGIIYNGIEMLEVLLGGGNHTVLVEESHAAMTTLSLGAGQDVANVRRISGQTILQTGAGSSTINIGSLAPESGGTLNGINAELIIEGEGADDTVNIDDTGDTSDEKAVLTGSTLTGLGMTGTIQYHTLDQLNINLGAGSTVFNVQGTSTETNIHFNDGDEQIYVSSQADFDLGDSVDFLPGHLDDVAGPLMIDAGAGQHLLGVSDQAATQADTNIILTNDMITGLAPAGINYIADAIDGSFSRGIEVWTGSGNNIALIDSTHKRQGVSTLTTLNMGLGDDQVTIDLDQDTDGPFVLNTQGQADDENASDADVVDGSTSSLDLIIHAGQGNDDITGGSGQDQLFGQGGNDTLNGREGDDQLLGQEGDDTLDGGSGNDIVIGDSALITYESTESGTQLSQVETEANAGSGNDDLSGGPGLDILLGGAGEDMLDGNEGQDLLLGDFGRVTYESGVAEPLPNALMSLLPEQGGADNLMGDSENDFLIGGFEEDLVSGGDGNDIILGDNGQIDLITINGALFPIAVMTTDIDQGADDVLNGDEGNDLILGGLGGDMINGGDQDDHLLGDHGQATYAQTESQTELISLTTTDPQAGGDDIIDGGQGNDVGIGGTGADEINGGPGHDRLAGDFVQYDAGTLTSILTDNVTDAGDDLIQGGDGNDIIIGQQGNDTLLGDAGDDDLIGGHNVLAGADGDDRLEGGDDADVVIGDNGLITREEIGAFQWQRYPEPFADIIRDVSLFDQIDGIVGNDTLFGGDGRDQLFAQQGDDRLFAGAGDDDLVGGLGDDILDGEGGHDILIADAGQIARDFNTDGSPRINENGAWRRNIFLEELGTVTDVIHIDSIPLRMNDPQLAEKLLSADQIIITGSFDANGRKLLNSDNRAWDTNILLIDLLAASNDTLDGGAGDDLLFGQRGSDTLNGGDNRDVLFGDRASNLVPFATELPHIQNGLRLLGVEAGAQLPFDIADGGSVIMPPVELFPQEVNAVSSFAFDASFGAVIPDSLNDFVDAVGAGPLTNDSGQSLVPYLSIVPSLVYQQDALAGNDTLSGGDGDDLIFGDSGKVYAEIIGEFKQITDARDQAWEAFNGLTENLHHLGLDYRHLEELTGPVARPHDITVGSDQIDGGDGSDQIFGDDGVLIQTFQATAPLDEGHFVDQTVEFYNYLRDLEHLAGDLSAVVFAAHHDVVSELTGIVDPQNTGDSADPDYHDLHVGNDAVDAGNGNDLIVGDSGVMVTAVVTGQSFDDSQDDLGFSSNLLKDLNNSLKKQMRKRGNALKTHDQKDLQLPGDLISNAALRDIAQDYEYDLFAGNNTIDGGAQDDLVLGNVGVFITPLLSENPQTDGESRQAQRDVDRFLKDVSDFVNDQFGRQQEQNGSDNPYGNRAGRNNLRVVLAGNDILTADAGDVVLADGAALTTAFQPGAPNDPFGLLRTNVSVKNLSTNQQLKNLNQRLDSKQSSIDSDTINGGQGDYTIFGQWGDDNITTTGADSAVFGGSGRDTLNAAGSASQAGGDLPGNRQREMVSDTLFASMSVFRQFVDDLADQTTPDRTLLNFDAMAGYHTTPLTQALGQTTVLSDGEFLTTTADRNQPDTIHQIPTTGNLPSYVELTTTVNITSGGVGNLRNGFILFDYQSDTEFKFAGISDRTNKLIIGSRTAEGWVVESQTRVPIRSNTDYQLRLILSGDTASLILDGQRVVAHEFDDLLSDGTIGVAAQQSSASFSDFQMTTLPN